MLRMDREWEKRCTSKISGKPIKNVEQTYAVMELPSSPPPVLLWATDWATRARAGLSVLPLAVCPKPLGLQLAGSWNALQPGPQQGVVCLLGLLQDNQWDAIK